DDRVDQAAGAPVDVEVSRPLDTAQPALDLAIEVLHRLVGVQNVNGGGTSDRTRIVQASDHDAAGCVGRVGRLRVVHRLVGGGRRTIEPPLAVVLAAGYTQGGADPESGCGIDAAAAPGVGVVVPPDIHQDLGCELELVIPAEA